MKGTIPLSLFLFFKGFCTSCADPKLKNRLHTHKIGDWKVATALSLETLAPVFEKRLDLRQPETVRRDGKAFPLKWSWLGKSARPPPPKRDR